MQYNPKIHRRRSIRLPGYDYSSEGSYFVTACVYNRECVLGEIHDGQMIPSGDGDIVNRCWSELRDDFTNLSLDVYQVMPNHFHGIVVLWEPHRRDLINQIPTGNSRIPTINHIRSGDDDEIPTGIHDSRFGPTQGWQQMKNPRQTLGKIIRHFKAKATKEIRDAGFPDFRWQARFHDRVIRNEEELDRIREYIRNNPRNWEADDENPRKSKS